MESQVITHCTCLAIKFGMDATITSEYLKTSLQKYNLVTFIHLAIQQHTENEPCNSFSILIGCKKWNKNIMLTLISSSLHYTYFSFKRNQINPNGIITKSISIFIYMMKRKAHSHILSVRSWSWSCSHSSCVQSKSSFF